MEIENSIDILRQEKVQKAIKEKTPIIISGEQETKGKTSLKKLLKSSGAVVFEKWECLEIELIN